jgi:hypothetical protein
LTSVRRRRRRRFFSWPSIRFGQGVEERERERERERKRERGVSDEFEETTAFKLSSSSRQTGCWKCGQIKWLLKNTFWLF